MTRITGYDVVRSDRAFRWLVDVYQDEFPKQLHLRGGKKGVGVQSSAFRRVLEDKFILWVPAYDPVTGAPLWVNPEETDLNKRRAKLTHSRPRNEDDPDEWVMPAHEAVKHVAKDPDGYRWLRAALVWRHAQCFCNHPSIIEHIAAANGAHVHDVITAVRRAAQFCVREIERAGALPDAPVRSERSSNKRHPARQSRGASGSIASLPRTYDP